MAYVNVQYRGIPPLDLPADLRLWVGEDRLLRLVIEAASHSDVPSRGGRDFQHGNEAFPVPQLLGVLAFAYLSGRFGSEEIEDAMESDVALRYLCASHYPSSTLLRRFRRIYGPALSAVIRPILHTAIAERLASTWLTSATGHDSGRVVWSDEAIAQVSRQSASDRLSRAMLADTIALDV